MSANWDSSMGWEKEKTPLERPFCKLKLTISAFGGCLACHQYPTDTPRTSFLKGPTYEDAIRGVYNIANPPERP